MQKVYEINLSPEGIAELQKILSKNRKNKTFPKQV